MDGDGHPQKKYDPMYMASSDIGQPRIPRQGSGSSIDRLGQRQQQQVSATMPPQDGSTPLTSYGGFEYPEPTPYNSSQLQSGPLQYQQGFSGSRNPSQATQQHHQSPQEPQSHQQRLPQFDPGMVYNMTPHAQAQSSYYQPRHSAAIEVLATQFGVPQYFPPDESAGSAGATSQYLSPQDQPSGYSQLRPVSRANVETSFPENIPGFNPTATSTEVIERQETTHRPTSSMEEGYARYQQMLRQTFHDVQAGRLHTASESLLEMSEWLLGNAGELGLVRDQEDLHADRVSMWDQFNTCWLAVCQKQKDMTRAMFETGVRAADLLSEETLQKMGKELVRLCDNMEQHGLVDYQMGVWEEEIVSVLEQCLDLLEADTTGVRNRPPMPDR
ncbi:hypothetical protein FQN57_006374 [Myotisia sp. PD_48]|nr:hypothetical protein FQN57_006374 [Myotisia sp. PD_48]